MHRIPLALVVLLATPALSRAAGEPGAAPAPAGPKPIPVAKLDRKTPVDFEKEVLPILQTSCLACHSRSKPKADLVLETPADIRKGGENGPAVVPGKGRESLLIQASAHEVEDGEMPPPDNKVNAPKLTPEQLGLLQLWIDQGAAGEVRASVTVEWQAVPKTFNAIYAVAVSPDGQFAACGRGNRIHVYHLPSGKLAAEVRDPQLDKAGPAAHRDLVQSLAFHPDGRLLASGSYREVKLWRRPEPGGEESSPAWPLDRTIGTAEGDSPLSDRVNALDFSPDGRWLAAGGGVPSRAGEIRLFEVATGRQERAYDDVHTDAVLALDFAPDGKRLASGAADRYVRVIDVTRTAPATAPTAVPATAPATVPATGPATAPGKPAPPFRTFEGHAHHVLGLSWKADGRTLVSAGADNTLKVWDTETGERKKTVTGFDKEVTAVRFVGETDQFVAASGEGKVKLIKESGSDVRSFSGAGGDFLHAATATSDGKLIVAGGQDGVLRVWSAADGKVVATLGPPKE